MSWAANVVAATFESRCVLKPGIIKRVTAPRPEGLVLRRVEKTTSRWALAADQNFTELACQRGGVMNYQPYWYGKHTLAK